MNSLEMKKSLFMNKSRFAEVNIGSAKVGGQVNMIGSVFKGFLSMHKLDVKQHLLMNNGAEFAEVDLSSAQVGGQLEMNGSTFVGLLSMNSLEVKQSLFMHEVAHFTEVDLTGAKVGGQLMMKGSRFKGPLSMNRSAFADALTSIHQETPFHVQTVHVQETLEGRSGHI